MLKRSIKYLVIVFINAVALYLYLSYWPDKFDHDYGPFLYVLGEYLKIFAVSFIGLGLMRLLSYLIGRKTDERKIFLKTTLSVLVILALSTPLYWDYYNKHLERVEDLLRQQLLSKISDGDFLAMGSRGSGLTRKEYSKLIELAGFPKIHETASQISYAHYFDGFLPDFLLKLEYVVPDTVKIDTVTINKPQYHKTIKTFSHAEGQKVVYEEGAL
jgi:hypothetical protein